MRPSREKVPAPTRHPGDAGVELHRTVLDAVGSLVVEHGWDSLSVAQIAAEAGVSTPVVAEEFGDRESLLEAYVIRETAHLLDRVEAVAATRLDDLGAALRAAFSAALRLGGAHPVIKAVVNGEISASVLDPLIAAPGSPLIDLAAGRLSAFLAAHVPWVTPGEVEALSDVLVRVTISYLTQGERDIDDTTEQVALVFGPFLRERIEARRP